MYQSPSAATRISTISSTGFIGFLAGGAGSAGSAGPGSAVSKSLGDGGAAPSAPGHHPAGWPSVCGVGGSGGCTPVTGSGSPSFTSSAGLLANPRSLANLVAQVVQLGAADVADAGNVDAVDAGRVHRERTLHEHLVERLLAHGERLSHTRALTLDADPLEHLHAASRALDHLEVDAHGVPCLELGHLAALSVLDVLDHGHGSSSSSSEAAESYQPGVG